MKIVLIGTTAACVIGFRADLIKALVGQGHFVYAFALDYDLESKKAVQDLGAVPVDYKFSRSGLNPVGDILNTIKLSLVLFKIAPDLVFSYFSKPVIFGTIAAVLARVKRRIGMLEGLGYYFTDQPGGMAIKSKIVQMFQVILYRISFRFLERIVFLNPDDPVDLLDKHKLTVGSMSILGGIGVDFNSFPFSVPKISPVTFIFVGRFLVEKGVNEYVAAAREVKKKYPETKFVMIGGLDEENPGGLSSVELKKLVDDGVVIWPGHVSNVHEWVSDSSVFVLPSYREGIPRSTQEAMAIGRPVITTDVPGCRETVEDGKSGFLVPPWSSEELVSKMVFFIENPEQIIIMGLESYKLAQKKFDAVSANEKMLSLFFG